MSLASGWANAQVIVGVTDDSANAALDTLPDNPHGHTRCIAIAIGEGVYVEDAGTSRPMQSGVTATGVDVRSSVASAAFICFVIDVAHMDLMELDHSATTT